LKKTMAIGITVLVLAAAAGGVRMLAPMRHGTTDNTNSSVNSGSTVEVPANKPNTVVIDNYKFGPNKITVKRGTRVTWVNRDQDRHNVKPDQESPGFEAGPLLAKGEQYSVTFDIVGTYKYHCSPHPYMKASVEVTE
jgi:amicyanin